jgi:hypothetical protein
MVEIMFMLLFVSPDRIRDDARLEIAWERGLYQDPTTEWIVRNEQSLYGGFLAATGMNTSLATYVAQSEEAGMSMGMKAGMGDFGNNYLPMRIRTFFLTLQLVLARSLNLFIWLPPFLLLLVAVGFDTNALRSIRGWAFEREDNALFNWAKHGVIFFKGLVYMTLISPWPIYPALMPLLLIGILLMTHMVGKNLQKI